MKTPYTRRKFIQQSSLALGAAALIRSQDSDAQSSSEKKHKMFGIALVGLCSYATHELAPALQQTKNCFLAGIVTGTPAKEKIWAEKYSIDRKNIYNYQNFDSIADNTDIRVGSDRCIH